MDFEWFSSHPKVRYTILLLVLLVVIQMIAGWSVRESYELYRYDKCTQYLNNRYSCEKDSSQATYVADLKPFPFFQCTCPSPNSRDCQAICNVTQLYLLLLIQPIIVLVYLIIFHLIYYLFGCKIHGLLQLKQILWILCYVVCCVEQFAGAFNVKKISNYANLEVYKALIGMGCLSILIMMNIFALNYLLHQFFTIGFQDEILFKQQIDVCKAVSQQYKDISLINIVLIQQKNIIQMLTQKRQLLLERKQQSTKLINIYQEVSDIKPAKQVQKEI